MLVAGWVHQVWPVPPSIHVQTHARAAIHYMDQVHYTPPIGGGHTSKVMSVCLLSVSYNKKFSRCSKICYKNFQFGTEIFPEVHVSIGKIIRSKSQRSGPEGQLTLRFHCFSLLLVPGTAAVRRRRHR